MFSKLSSALSTVFREINTTAAARSGVALARSAVDKTWVGVNAPTSKDGSRRATVANRNGPPNQPVKLRTANPANALRAQSGRRDCMLINDDLLFSGKCNIDGGPSNLAVKFRTEFAASATSCGSSQAQQKASNDSTRPSVAALVKATPHLKSGAKGSDRSLPQLEMSSADKVQLREHIENIKKVLTVGTYWEYRSLTSDLAEMDWKFMPRLVESANLSKPGLDLQYADTVQAGCDLLKSAVKNGDRSGQYIVNSNSDRQIHFCAINYRKIGKVPSVIIFESSVFQRSTFRLLDELSKIPKMRLLVVKMDIQRSRQDCGIFSLAFSKKLHKEQDWMAALHKKNAAGKLHLSEPSSTTLEETDRLVPLSLYKHSQTRKRPAEYLKHNPDKGNAVVNKRNETLLEFQQRHTRHLPAGLPCVEQPPDSIISFSIHDKRLREYEQLDARTVEVRPEGHPGTADAGATIA